MAMVLPSTGCPSTAWGCPVRQPPCTGNSRQGHAPFFRQILTVDLTPGTALFTDIHTMATTYTISDLAKEFDLTTRAMRFYEDMGLLQPQREGPGGRNRVYTARDRTRLKLTLRAKRLGLSLVEAKEIIDSYDSPRDTAPQLSKFLAILADHRKKLQAQMLDLQANLDELRAHEKEARTLLLKAESKSQGKAQGRPENKAVKVK